MTTQAYLGFCRPSRNAIGFEFHPVREKTSDSHGTPHSFLFRRGKLRNTSRSPTQD